MREQRPVAVKIPADSKEPERPAIITFEPEQIVRGICFHLLDDHHASKISPTSVVQTRERLIRQKVILNIARRQWEIMSHRERLDWLLERSRILASYSGVTATLVHS